MKSAVHFPAVNDVADQVKMVARMFFKERQQHIGVAVPATEMHIGDKNTTHALAHSFVHCRSPKLRELDRRHWRLVDTRIVAAETVEFVLALGGQSDSSRQYQAVGRSGR